MWSVLIPVKRLPEAKSRLAPLPAEQRGALALAFAADVLTAALAVPQVRAVYVVTGDPRVSRQLAALGARLIPDPGAGLNGAYEAGLARARADSPEYRVLAMNADLPALRAADLGAFLDSVGPGRAVVPDVEGTGSTLPMMGARCWSGRRSPRPGTSKTIQSESPRRNTASATRFGQSK